jgi:hypothetical protein
MKMLRACRLSDDFSAQKSRRCARGGLTAGRANDYGVAIFPLPLSPEYHTTECMLSGCIGGALLPFTLPLGSMIWVDRWDPASIGKRARFDRGSPAAPATLVGICCEIATFAVGFGFVSGGFSAV